MAVVTEDTDHDHIDTELAIARRIVASGASILYRLKGEPGFPLEYLSGNLARYGYSPADWTDGRRSWQDSIHCDDRERVVTTLENRLAAGATRFEQSYRMYTASGDTVWMDDQVVVHYGVDGRPSQIEGSLTDETDRRHSKRAIREALAQTIRAIGSVVGMRDAYTGGHQRRVADLSIAIGRLLGLSVERLEGLYLGALVHDVGKISIPLDVLSKPSRLTTEEMALVRTHVRTGVALLEGIQLPWKIVDIIAQHHERLDGSGYPDGLTEDAILLEARIVSVADVFEAMGEHRPYRAAYGADAAFSELETHCGTRFDPAVVDACRQVVTAHGAASNGLWLSLVQREDADSTVIMHARDLPLGRTQP